MFVGYGPRSQRFAGRISLMIEKLKNYYEVSLIHVPDDTLDELPYVRIEPPHLEVRCGSSGLGSDGESKV